VIHTLTLNPALDREYRVAAIAFGEVLRADAVRDDLGGKGFNVSRALLALGEPSVALGFVGGLTGRRIAEGLAALDRRRLRGARRRRDADQRDRGRAGPAREGE
jgi:fructose-1-phosphate kinase PfkB-like protein